MGLLVQQWVSVDGYVAGPNGEGDVFAAVEDFSPSERHNVALLENVDEMLMGRRTYEEFRQFWPTADGEPMARYVNALPKTVCSTSLTEAPWGEHAPAQVVGDAVAHVREGRQGGRGDTIVWGSITLMRELLAAGEVDRLELLVAPVLLRTGTPLLAADGPPVGLSMEESESWDGGVTRARYTIK